LLTARDGGFPELPALSRSFATGWRRSAGWGIAIFGT